MLRQRILVYSGDPGGAEAVAPVIRLFPGDWDVKVMAKASARPVFRDFGARPLDCTAWTWDEIEKACRTWAPTAMLLSSSSLPQKDATESRLRAWARDKGIPAVAVMDSWQNYSMRFKHPVSGKIEHLPTRLAAMDAGAAKDMVADGLPKAMLSVTGHPGLEAAGTALRSRRVAKTGAAMHPSRSRLASGKSLRICHFSQPLRDFWGDSLGYDEFAVAKDLISLIPVLEKGLKRKINLAIKLHPKESRSLFRKEVGKLPSNVKILPANADSLAALGDCDVAMGMGTIMLVKAALGGVPAVCYSPGKAASVENACIIAKRRLIPIVRSKKALEGILSGLASGRRRAMHLEKQGRFGRHQGAAENVYQLMRSLCT